MAELPTESSGELVEEFPSEPEKKLGGVVVTDCRKNVRAAVGSPNLSVTPTTHNIGGEMMTFVPFAHFKSGNQVHTKSVGYHSDGDVILFKEDVSSSDSELKRGERKKFVLTTSHRVEQPLNQDKIEARGIRAFPGVTGPKGKQKHRRWRNQFFVDEDVVALLEESGHKPSSRPKITKEQFQDLFTHRTATDFGFYNSDGEVDRRWEPFIEITEEKQAILLEKYNKGKTAKPPQDTTLTSNTTVSQRWNRIGKPLRSELVRLKGKRDTFFKPVETRLLEYIKAIDRSKEDCTEVDPLVLKFDDGYHRLLCHGVVTYYGLFSVSETGDDGDRYTLVHPPKRCPTPFPVPEMSLLDYLTAEPTVKQHPPTNAQGKRRKMKKRPKQP
eukprot:TRINITY_DN7_c0_g2_i10.p1 TRINITY_DN7_c0_g2~~TRINITY_DN7_c0_g2_i10.p1  ORF type:complete len:384 (+),score=57.45 TRINITY_DN7_c0_g2_i10:507-1658(+)